jgi:hypothetical protein
LAGTLLADKEVSMLCSIKELDGFELSARDGDIGHAREVYFDDKRWVVRHLVADTGGWLSGRSVLISPHSISAVDRAQKKLAVALSRDQIEKAPGIETDKPMSRQQEIPYYDYYGYPYYWSGTGLWGMEGLPLGGAELLRPADAAVPRELADEMNEAARESADVHLRSSAEVTGYKVEATDGGIGHIADFLIDDQSWQIRFAVIDTHNWLPDRLVLVDPHAIADIDWNEHRVHVRLTREAVKASPPYQRSASISHDEANRVQRHYEGWQ